MKKLLVLMAAAFAMVACQTDINEVGVAGGEVNVTFEVGTPTRAYSDGRTATVLEYAVYEGETELTALTRSVKGNNPDSINISKTVSFKLVTGNTYTVIFWAAAPEAPYTVDFANKTMTIDYNGVKSNNENLDAFYKRHTFTVNGAQTETIELRRPFAQLNIGTSDYTASANAGYTPDESYVKVTKLGNVLNLWNDKVEGTDEVITFDYATIPTTETFPVTGYEYLAMNYLLVDSEKEVVDIVFGYTETDANAAKTRTVGSVPVQRNYRTNIYGQLLTSDVDINIEIKPAYNEPSHEADALHKAALNGGEITLTEDVVLTTPLEVVGELTINLNGKTISGALHKSVGPIVKNSGTLTIVGGTISSLAKNGGSAIANYGNLTVENVAINGAEREGDSWPAYPVNNYGDMTLTNTTIVGHQGCIALNAAGTTVLNNCDVTKNYMKTSSHVFYVNHADAKVIVNGGTYNHNGFDGSLAYVIAGEVTINGGTFSAKDGGYGFAALSAGKVIINGGNINAGLLNWGGKFVVNGGVYTSKSKPNENYLAEGYKAVEKDGKFYVVAEDADAIATTQSELASAVTTGGKVVLTAGEYTFPAGDSFNANTVLTCEEGVVFEGNSKLNINGATIVGATFSNPAGTAVDQTINGTFKGCTFEGKNGARWCYAGDTVVFEDCVFSGSTYGVHFDGGANDVLFKNCVLSGFNALGGEITMTTFEGCTFVGNGKSGYNGANLWGSTKLINCEFTFDGSTATEWMHGRGDNKTYEFENCTVNGVALTSENYDSFDQIGAYGDASTVKVNGVTVVSDAASLKAAIINGGKIAFANDITVDEWIMFSEDLNISDGTIITIDNINVSIDGNGHTLTVNAIESAGNNDQLFQGASVLNISNLTIKYADGLTTGGLGLDSGVIKNVHFIGGGSAASSAAIFPHNGVIKVEDCIFDTNGVALYFDDECDNLSVTGCTFNLKDNKNIILLRGDVKFTDNIINTGRTVNVVSGSPVVTGNNFNNVRFKVYGAATATISNNIINNLEFDGTTYASTFSGNTLSAAAQAVLDAATKVN